MSTDAVPVSSSGAASRRWELRTARVMRYAVGVTFAVAIAFSFEWPLAKLTPILAAFFLALRVPKPTLVQGVVLFGYVLCAFLVGLAFTLFLLPYAFVFMPLFAVVVFHIFYRLNRGGSPFLGIMMLLAVLLLPMLALSNDALALVLSLCFTFSAGLAVLIFVLAHGLIPDPDQIGPARPRRARAKGFVPVAAQRALKSTVVVLPLAVIFFTANLADLVLVLIFAAMYVINPNLTAGRGAGLRALASTLLGGVVAFVFHIVLLPVPEFLFLLVLMFLTTMLLAGEIFSDKSYARFMPSAATTFILLTFSSTAEGATFADAFFTRLGLILLTTVYVASALALLERVWPSSDAVPSKAAAA